MHPNTLAQTKEAVSGFLQIMHDHFDAGMVMPNSKPEHRENFHRQLKEASRQCALANPTERDWQEIEDFLIVVLRAYDAGLLFEGMPARNKKVFIECLNIAGKASAVAAGNIPVILR